MWGGGGGGSHHIAHVRRKFERLPRCFLINERLHTDCLADAVRRAVGRLRSVEFLVQRNAKAPRVRLHRVKHLLADALLHAEHIHVEAKWDEGREHLRGRRRARRRVRQIQKRIAGSHVPVPHP